MEKPVKNISLYPSQLREGDEIAFKDGYTPILSLVETADNWKINYLSTDGFTEKSANAARNCRILIKSRK